VPETSGAINKTTDQCQTCNEPMTANAPGQRFAAACAMDALRGAR